MSNKTNTNNASNNLNIPKLYCMVGLSASGKSSIAKEIAKKDNCIIVSSDNIREEIREGGILDQSKNNEVFRIFHKRIKENLDMGKNVIADATNITMKSRRSLLENLKKISCYKIAYIVPKRLNQCVKDNQNRTNIIPKEILKKQLMSFQIPFIEEGFDEIIIHKFKQEEINEYFIKECYYKMEGFDQKNPHHNMDLYNHCQFVKDIFKSNKKYINTEYPLASSLHDLGKLFTQKIDKNGIAHYYKHENVSTYFLLQNINNLKYSTKYGEKEILNILFLINYHMLPMNWSTFKTKMKWKKRFGNYKYNLLLDFYECDKSRENIEKVYCPYCANKKGLKWTSIIRNDRIPQKYICKCCYREYFENEDR